MAWIESHQALGRHPKTLRLADALGCSVPAAVGHLHYLWWWALDYAPDGLVAASDKLVVARACLWKGRPERFFGGLEGAGFVEHTDMEEVFKIHDWMDYAGRLVEQRAANAERMRNARAKHVQRTSGTRAGATGPDQPDQPEDAAAAGAHPSRARPREAAGFQHIGAILANGAKTAAAAAAQNSHFEVTDELRAEHEQRLEQERRARS